MPTDYAAEWREHVWISAIRRACEREANAAMPPEPDGLTRFGREYRRQMWTEAYNDAWRAFWPRR